MTTMSTTNTTNQTRDEKRRQKLSATYTTLGQRVAELTPQVDPFSDRLRQIVEAHQKEVARKLNNEPGSACYLERVLAFQLYATILLDRYMKHLLAKNDRKERWTPEERKTLKSLHQALGSFMSAIDRLAPTFGLPAWTSERLAPLLWFNFTGMTAEETQHEAAEIIRILDEAKTTA